MLQTNFTTGLSGLSPEMPRLAALPVGEAAGAASVDLQLPRSIATAEVANTITHGLGFLLSLVAAVVLISQAGHTDRWQFVACIIYVATMVAVYAASTASHAFQQPRVNHFFRMLDQGCIYLFIAGSFTPLAAIFLSDGAWWALLAAMWGIATAGFVSKMFLQHRIDCASVAIPALLGCLPLVCGPAILNRMPAVVLWWMLAGGICYILGTFFLINDRRHRYLHAVWHLWVIAGSACHFWAIFQYALPTA